MQTVRAVVRAVDGAKRAVSIALRAVSTALRAVSTALRAVSVALRAVSTALRAVSVALRAVSVALRAVSVARFVGRVGAGRRSSARERVQLRERFRAWCFARVELRTNRNHASAPFTRPIER